MLYAYNGRLPQVDSTVFVAPGARLVGDITIGLDSSIWFNAVLRGDLAPVHIGKRVNIQDGSVGHVNYDQSLLLSDDVSVGHHAVIHGCSIGTGSLIGMGAIILNGADLGEYTFVAAGSLVPENSVLPAYTLCMGTPVKIIRELTEADLLRMKRTTESYVLKSREYLKAMTSDEA